jgi:hypothetical protein
MTVYDTYDKTGTPSKRFSERESGNYGNSEVLPNFTHIYEAGPWVLGTPLPSTPIGSHQVPKNPSKT